MTVASRSLIGRVFLWNYTHLVKDSYRAQAYREDGTNLCHLIRTVFLVVPLKVIGMTVVAMLVTFALELPFLHHGLWGGFAVYGFIVGLVLLALAICVMCCCGIKHLTDTREPPESLVILAAWVAARKARICPLVRFDE